MNSPRSIPKANATALDPMDIHNSTLLRNVAVDHETVINCNLLIPNGTTDHTQLTVCIISNLTRTETQFKMNAYKQLKSMNLGFIIFKRGLTSTMGASQGL